METNSARLMFLVLLGALSLPNIAVAEFVFDVGNKEDLSETQGLVGDGFCNISEKYKVDPDKCTLRAAIEEINASSVESSSCGVFDFTNRVNLPRGIYTLAPGTPPLDISRDENDRDVCVYIVGTSDNEGPMATVINGGSPEGKEGTLDDRSPSSVFSIHPRGRLALNGVTITRGHIHFIGGGAIRNQGDLAIYRSHLTKNSTHGRGGAIYNTGNLWILESTLSYNWALPNTLPNFDGGMEDTDIDGDGIADKIAEGALANVGGNVYMQNVTISGNKGGGINPHTNRDSQGDGGAGILNVRGGVVQMSNTTIANNFADGTSGSDGAGIYNDRNSTVYLSNTIAANNSSAKRPKDEKHPDDCRGTLKSFDYNLVGAKPSNCMISRF